MAIRPPDQDALNSWYEALERFEKYFWPIFEKFGYRKEAAFLYWSLHRMESSLDDIVGVLLSRDTKDNPDDGEEWKH